MDLYIIISNSCRKPIAYNNILLPSNFVIIWVLFVQHFQNPSYLLLQSIMTTTAIVLIIFIFCYFGHMVTADCELAASSVYNALWYQFPISLQESIIFIMARAQHPFYLTAFKMYRCWLHSFTGVRRIIFFYHQLKEYHRI